MDSNDSMLNPLIRELIIFLLLLGKLEGTRKATNRTPAKKIPLILLLFIVDLFPSYASDKFWAPIKSSRAVLGRELGLGAR
jgi:hypothetical protein